MSEPTVYGPERAYCFTCGQPVPCAPALASGADDLSQGEGLAEAEAGADRLEAVLAYLEERGYLPPDSAHLAPDNTADEEDQR